VGAILLFLSFFLFLSSSPNSAVLEEIFRETGRPDSGGKGETDVRWRHR